MSLPEEAVELSSKHGLYLIKSFKLTINVIIPQNLINGVSISNWDIMEKLRNVVAPQQLLNLAVVSSSLKSVVLEAEADSLSICDRFIRMIDDKNLKFGGVANPFRLKAQRSTSNCPKNHDWEVFFRDAENLNERKPGERPDTVVLKGLPVEWFSSGSSGSNPDKNLIVSIFSRFGEIRRIDLPNQESRSQSEGTSPSQHSLCSASSRNWSGFGPTFELFIQYRGYNGFLSAMNGLRNKKIARLKDRCLLSVDFVVDFDRTAHLSDRNIARRENERERLIKQQRSSTNTGETSATVQPSNELHFPHSPVPVPSDSKQRLEDDLLVRKRRRQQEKTLRRARKEERRGLHRQLEKLQIRRQREARVIIDEVLKLVAIRKEEEEEERRRREREENVMSAIFKKRQYLEEEVSRIKHQEEIRQLKLLEQESLIRDKLMQHCREAITYKKRLEQECMRRNPSTSTGVIVDGKRS